MSLAEDRQEVEARAAVGGGLRYAYLDGLRGLAASTVVICHFIMSFLPYASKGGVAPLHFGWERLFLHPPLGLLVAGHFAVCLFFLMSGFVLAAPLLARGAPVADLLAAFVKRPFRLAGVVVATCSLALGLWQLGWFKNMEAAAVSGSEWLTYFWGGVPPTWGHAAADMLQNPFPTWDMLNAPLWTIKRELLGSWLVFGLLLLRPAPVRIFVTVALTFWFARNLMQWFVIGLLLAEWHHYCAATGRQLRLPNLVCALLFIVAVICGSYPKFAYPETHAAGVFARMPVLPWLAGGWPGLGALAMMLLTLYCPAFQRVLTAGPVLFAGRISYAMYGTHFLMVGSVGAFVLVSCHNIGYGVALVCALTSILAATLVMAVLVDRFVDRPSVALSQQIGAGVKACCNRLF